MKLFLKNWKKVLRFIFLYFLIVGTFQYVGGLSIGINLDDQSGYQGTSLQALELNLLGLAGTLLTVWIFLKFTDKRPFSSLGLKASPWGSNAIGIATGFLIMGLGISILLLLHQTSIVSINVNLNDILISICTFIVISITEEVMMRGYILHKLMRHYNQWTALILSSIFFSLMHVFNPHINFLAIINLFLAGVLLGIPYMYTRNLWCSIALHFSWNFFQSIFGFNVSGMDLYSVFIQARSADNVWNGGAFGYEGSIYCILSQVVAIALFYFFYRKKPREIQKALHPLIHIT